jgi:hypothetical protein
MNHTKKAALFRLLARQWVTPLDAMQKCRIMTLSQRVSEWRRDGHTIIDKWVESRGARFKAYRLVKAK